MKIKVGIFYALLTLPFFIKAQSNILNAKTVNQIGLKSIEENEADDKPIPYGYIDDRDIMWSKVVWEHIDLNQKINFPYYFPTDTMDIALNRRCLFHTLVNGIKKKEITEIYSDSNFTEKITIDEVNEVLVSKDNNGFDVPLGPEDISGYALKGLWYFDKRQGELKYRLLAIAPLGADVKRKTKNIEDDGTLYDLFWVFYSDARKVLHKSKVFNPKNALHPISYDHLLNARRFNSVIVREENIYGDRAIEHYVRGNSLFQLLEADKIKEDIRNREMDMWNY